MSRPPALVQKFRQLKSSGKKIVITTSYDYWSARILSMCDIDAILVGDCSTMVMHGYENTLSATVDSIAAHTRDVRKGAPEKFIVAAFPFLSTRKGLDHATEMADRLLKAGAQAIKIEGAGINQTVIPHLIESGIPVVGHIGLQPSQHHMVDGFRVQGKTAEDAIAILDEAKLMEQMGCFAVVLEAVPPHVGKMVSEALEIPVIGVGAGLHVDGQALVLQDMLGLTVDFKPKFVRKYLDGAQLFVHAINQFAKDVSAGDFPAEPECYLPATNDSVAVVDNEVPQTAAGGK